MIKRTLLAFAIATLASTSAQAQDWRNRSKQTTMHEALIERSMMCEEFGFTKMEHPSTTAVLSVELSLSSSPEQRYRDIVAILNEAYIEDADDEIVERMVDATEAALLDPSSFDRARERFVAVMSGPLHKAYNGCLRGSNDPFVALHYWSGTGDFEVFIDEVVRQSFAGQVERLKEFRNQ